MNIFFSSLVIELSEAVLSVLWDGPLSSEPDVYLLALVNFLKLFGTANFESGKILATTWENGNE